MLNHLKQSAILLAISPIVVAGTILAAPVYLFQSIFKPAAGWKTALAVDDLGNAAIGGHLGQTISAHSAFAAAQHKPLGVAMCRILDAVDPGHCARAISAREQNLNTATQSDALRQEVTKLGMKK